MSILGKIFYEYKCAVDSLELLPDDRKKWKLFYLLDILFCELKYGTHPEDYIALWFWNDMKSKDRKKWLTSGKRRKFGMKFYTKEAYDLLGNKKDFNNKFSKFLKRDWISSNETSEQQIRDFISKHERVIIKPLSLSCGEGVEIVGLDEIDLIINKLIGGGM